MHVQATTRTLQELAVGIGATLHGGERQPIRGAASLERARDDQLSFFSDRRYKSRLKTTKAGAVILAESDLADCPVPALVAPDPHLAFAQAMNLLYPPAPPRPGVAASACIDSGATVADDAWVGPGAIVEAGAQVGAGAYIGPHCYLGRDVQVAEGTRLVAHVVLLDGVRLGRNVLAHPGAVVGSDGFGFSRDGRYWLKIPQIGSVRVEDDVELGANTVIDRGALHDTVIGAGVKIDNMVHVAHNVQIGEHTAIAGCTGIGGSVVIGRYCRIGGACGIRDHIEIADDVYLTAGSRVARSIRKPGTYSSALPSTETGVFRRNAARFACLDTSFRDLQRDVTRLQADVEEVKHRHE